MDKFHSIIGNSTKLQAVIADARRIAGTNATVLVTGETGTGKEILVDAMQESSALKDRPFVAVNCAALPESIAESEMFGHLKGAFTGALVNRSGMVQAAEGGTLFLDEVDSLPLSIQAKLLRFLESGECRQVGDVSYRKVKVRLIAATNADLDQKIQCGEFRKDLYFRLNVVRLDLPALRDRKEDIALLVAHFVERFSSENNLDPPRINQTIMDLLQRYRWPGNVRELRNLCERLCILCGNRTVTLDDIPADIRMESGESEGRRAGRFPFSLPETGIDLEKVEIELINQALQRTRGNRTQSARLLGISRHALHYRMQKHAIFVGVA